MKFFNLAKVSTTPHSVNKKYTGIVICEDNNFLDPLKDRVGKGPIKSKWISSIGFDV